MKINKKSSLVILILIMLILLVAYIFINNNKLKVCPDEWISNQMPQSGGKTQETDYFIINGMRKEISNYDLTWIGANCSVKKQVVY